MLFMSMSIIKHVINVNNYVLVYIQVYFVLSGYDRKRECIVERPGPTVDHICGSECLDNHSVNLLSSLSTACVAPLIAFKVWTIFT